MLKLYIDTTDGMSQKKLSEETGVSETTISRFLAGERLPDAQAFAAIQAWCCGEHVPDPEALAKRVAALEEALKKAGPALRAAWMHVPLR